MRERGDDLLHDPIREIFLLRIAADILEWQNGDGGAARDDGLNWGGAHRQNAPGAHWPRDILEAQRACIFQHTRQTPANTLLYGLGNENTAGLRDGLKASGDIHVISEHIACFGNDVAERDTDPELDPVSGCPVPIIGRYGVLNSEGAAHCLDRARELGQEPVADCLDDPAAMPGDGRIDRGIHQVLEARVGKIPRSHA